MAAGEPGADEGPDEPEDLDKAHHPDMNVSDITSGINASGSLVGFSITLSGLAFEVFSAHCSSPWTSETFGVEPERADSTMRYVRKSIIVTEILGVGGVLLTDNLLPFVATSMVSAYMWWTYAEAISVAKQSKTTAAPATGAPWSWK